MWAGCCAVLCSGLDCDKQLVCLCAQIKPEKVARVLTHSVDDLCDAWAFWSGGIFDHGERKCYSLFWA